MMPHIKKSVTLTPKSMNQPKSGVYVFDFDQSKYLCSDFTHPTTDFSGWCRLNVTGSAGISFERLS